MAYTPKADREIRGGKAVVSAKEMADFRKLYGEDKTLRDLLNMDKGLSRKGDTEQAARKAAASADLRQPKALTASEQAAQDRYEVKSGKRSFDTEVEPDFKDTFPSNVRTRPENKTDLSDMTYKKGGKVKGWGKARGARAAKIY